ncbi:MAG: coenzyme F420-0:L-glutamate ligase [Oscillospiraceae bacterium]|nr:coenzyme F420-0:L-glutamate ligase [Oscillospiraceae bacterium]
MVEINPVGTVARGIRAPLIKKGDDIAAIAVSSVLSACEADGFGLRDGDVIGVTEAIVARAQGNYADCGHIAEDVRAKYPKGELVAVFPILSRNRFANVLKGIASGCDRLWIMLSYPADEVGNELITWDMLDASGYDPYTDVLTEASYREAFGYEGRHIFTNVDYVEYYKSFGDNIEIVFGNDARKALRFSPHALSCDIHTRARTKRLLRDAGAETVYGLDDIMSAPVRGSGYNERYGVLGSNMATADSVKLFPRDCERLVSRIVGSIKERTGKKVEALIYGDGAFKDPIGGIWELADPVVSPAYTEGLAAKANELKLKFLLDNDLAGLGGEELSKAVESAIRSKGEDGDRSSLGTTPRFYSDLLGSLCDLMSGSGDKGTPIILIQGYFDNYAS